MKLFIKQTIHRFIQIALLTCLPVLMMAQDSTAVSSEEEIPVKTKPVKNTFQSVWIIDNQTVMVPAKKTLEFDIMHRFGVINKGYKDFWGFFAPSNIRLGISYSPIDRLNLGIGLTKSGMFLDGSVKYAIITQTKKKYPVSVTYYGSAGIDTREEPALYDGSQLKHESDKMFFFHQLIIARKITSKLSIQVAPSVSHQNAVGGYYTKNDSTGKEIFKTMKNDHFAVSVAARYKLTEVTSLIFNYDQPLTKHATYNPDPNLSFGVEFNTSSHSFQIFFGNYDYLSQARNNLFNKNSPFEYNDLTKTHPERKADDPGTAKDESVRVRGGRFVIGFNITRLWNY